MSKEELTKINDAMPADAKYGDVFLAIAKAQDEISFKAGAREVVEWVRNHGGCLTGLRTDWHKKMKEWGISE